MYMHIKKCIFNNRRHFTIHKNYNQHVLKIIQTRKEKISRTLIKCIHPIYTTILLLLSCNDKLKLINSSEFITGVMVV